MVVGTRIREGETRIRRKGDGRFDCPALVLVRARGDHGESKSQRVTRRKREKDREDMSSKKKWRVPRAFRDHVTEVGEIQRKGTETIVLVLKVSTTGGKERDRNGTRNDGEKEGMSD